MTGVPFCCSSKGESEERGSETRMSSDSNPKYVVFYIVVFCRLCRIVQKLLFFDIVESGGIPMTIGGPKSSILMDSEREYNLLVLAWLFGSFSSIALLVEGV